MRVWGRAWTQSRPVVVRAYVPAADGPGARTALRDVRRSLGHLQAFGLRPIGALETRRVTETDWLTPWRRHFPVIRAGRRIVIRPSWRRHRAAPGDVVLALDPGVAFGTGLASHDASLPPGGRGLGRLGAGGRTRFLDLGVAPASWDSPPPGWGPGTCSASTSTRSRWRRPW